MACIFFQSHKIVERTCKKCNETFLGGVRRLICDKCKGTSRPSVFVKVKSYQDYKNERLLNPIKKEDYNK